MKPLLFLFIAHLVVCAAVGYFFAERISESHHEYDPPIDTTTAEERSRREASFHMSQSHVTYRFPGALNLYFLVGLLALVAAFVMELYQRFFPR
jgi:hypothetical protein